MRTTHITKPADVVKKWHIVDAQGKNLGRLSSEIAKILRGKHKPTYQPHVDCGDYVIVINAEKIEVTGKKMDQKLYFRHSGYIGGVKITTMRQMMAKKPEEILRHAIKGMLPKNVLGRAMFKKLHVYVGSEHNHQAQKPEPLILNY
ncbi:MAG: 50S ribosomal protein L13 [Defluviitaleaceae bacterium]|nr:50S ribosomal protein L13 [Defluviitaleaceae bacterium]